MGMVISQWGIRESVAGLDASETCLGGGKPVAGMEVEPEKIVEVEDVGASIQGGKKAGASGRGNKAVLEQAERLLREARAEADRKAKVAARNG